MGSDANLLAGEGAGAPPPPESDFEDDGDFPFEETLAQFRAEAAQAAAPEDADDDHDEDTLEERHPPPEKPVVEVKGADGDLPKGVRERLNKVAKARDDAKEEAAEARRLMDEERRTREELEARIADMEARIADPEPDFDSDPDKWRDWSKRDKAREVERAKKDREKAAAKPAAPSAAAEMDPDVARVGASVTAAQQRYRDYARFVNPVVREQINKDPALYDRIMQSDDPGEAAYRYGREVILGEKVEAEREERGAGRLSGAGGGYVPAPGGNKRGPATREEKYVSKFTSSWGIPGRNGGR